MADCGAAGATPYASVSSGFRSMGDIVVARERPAITNEPSFLNHRRRAAAACADSIRRAIHVATSQYPASFADVRTSAIASVSPGSWAWPIRSPIPTSSRARSSNRAGFIGGRRSPSSQASGRAGRAGGVSSCVLGRRHGYLLAGDGGIFNYGDAAFYGSVPGVVKVSPAQKVGMATSQVQGD